MNKIDFAIIITAQNCNPNADPTNRMPRHTYDGYGEISDVCIKRKIRDRLMEAGEEIIIIPNEKATDGIYSVKSRIKAAPELKGIKKPEEFIKKACKKWIDVRSFGQVFGYKDLVGVAAVSCRGPVSIWTARSLEPINISQVDIVKTTNFDKDTYDKDSTTLSCKYVIDKGVYVAYGSIFPQLADLTGFSDEDAEKIKNAILHLFDNDASAARPSGSMDVALIWAEHRSKNGVMSSAKVHRSFGIKPCDSYPYYTYDIQGIDGINVQVYE